MREKIITIISKVTKIETEELELKAAESKLWDSLKHVELIIMLEDEFDIFFEQDEIAGMKSVEKVIEVVERKAE